MSPRNRMRLPKRVKPCRVKDPQASSHTVYLMEGQTLEVVLSDGHPLFHEVNIKPKGEFLEIESVRQAHGGRLYTFKQVGNLENWSTVSTVFLGEIEFTSPGRTARVTVYLRSSNPVKRNVVTVINPKGYTVKLYPHQILEVVVYSPVWGMPLYWEADVSEDPRFEVLAHTYVQPDHYDPAGAVRQVNDAFFVYPRVDPAISVRRFLEFHFWLRCDQGLAKVMSRMSGESYPEGRLSFLGCVDTDVKETLDLRVIFNDRPVKDSYAPRSASVTYYDSDMAKGVAPTKKTTEIIPAKDLVRTHGCSSHHHNDWHSHQPASRHDWADYYYGHTGCVTTYTPKREGCLQTINVRQVKEPLFSGCKVKYLEDFPATGKVTVCGP